MRQSLRSATGVSTIPVNHSSVTTVTAVRERRGRYRDKRSHHGDKVTEPLVRQFVTDHQSHPLLGGGGGFERVNEQRRLSICHQAPVLHGACQRQPQPWNHSGRRGISHSWECDCLTWGKVSQSYEIHLWQGISNTEIVLIKWQRLLRNLDKNQPLW